ncbi:hypothetical protein JS530_05640 [Bifidobacterium sp. LC6]|uniref:Uncharacterized protein n=1 Tax=Bifidobacterium colobi TaxID=2809026 RepID=A0ABS5UVA1_9BIFI|nr:hypothetical protein [Bifidobacterium colobi]
MSIVLLITTPIFLILHIGRAVIAATWKQFGNALLHIAGALAAFAAEVCFVVPGLFPFQAGCNDLPIADLGQQTFLTDEWKACAPAAFWVVLIGMIPWIVSLVIMVRTPKPSRDKSEEPTIQPHTNLEVHGWK